jgi:hypothetical protein
MRAVRALGFGWGADRRLLAGLPPVVMGLATWRVFGGPACVTGLLLATLASFVVYLPVTSLVLSGGRAIAVDAAAPVLTVRAWVVLFGLWTATAWVGAAVGG